MKKIIITLVLNGIVTLCVIVGLIIFAQNAYPASALYNLKRFYENVEMSLQFSDQAKAAYYQILIDKRMEEIEQVYAEEQYQHILITSLRYVATTGNAVDFIIMKNLSQEGAQLKKTLSEDVKRFETLRKNLNPENEDGRFLTDAINYTSANIQKLENY